MTTDGGGFMLIGHKNNSITWSVPSNDDPVEPSGDPHWSSALGDAPMLDFRIQMSIGSSFDETKAHWSFRLNDKRPLQKLMIMGEKGCDATSPGIGDIAYVKDLLTENIVTTSFRCSKFGIGHHPLTKMGWNMMNSCLKKPCPWGFAYHHQYPVQVDFSGAFSYSVKQQVSGIVNSATAFVGCNNGQCCGCYGPMGGTDNYCSNNCQAVNGGTVKTSVYTWFWVRSTLPKRVWNKCMEYKIINDHGKVVWYKLTGGNVLPIEGRCVKNEALLNDGIIVVPDENIAKHIPAVPGLMAYRQDNKKLYVRANETWNVIAQEKKVTSVLSKQSAAYNSTIALLEQRTRKKLKDQTKILADQIVAMNATVSNLEQQVQSLSEVKFKNLLGLGEISQSAILQGNQGYITQLKQWLPFMFYRSKLCYRASRDGWSSSTFHSRCDNKGPTVTIVKSAAQYIFGGYADVSWGGSSRYIPSAESFIFSLRNYYSLGPFKAPVFQYVYNAVYTSSGYGPTFGGAHDLYICSYPNSNQNSYTNFGYTYRPPSGYSYTSSNTRTLLSGSNYNFYISEVEVFYLG